MGEFSGKVHLLFRAMLLLLIAGLDILGALQWVFPVLPPLEFAIYFGAGMAMVALLVAAGRLLMAVERRRAMKAERRRVRSKNAFVVNRGKVFLRGTTSHERWPRGIFDEV